MHTIHQQEGELRFYSGCFALFQSSPACFKMNARQSLMKVDTVPVPRRRRQLAVKERKITADEFMAASIGDVEWLDQSLRATGGVTANFDKNGLATIHLAALHGNLNCLKLLIEKYEVDVNLPSTTGWSALHMCINKELGAKALKCMKYLIEKGADVNSTNADNVTPAHQVASEGLLDCLNVLIEKKADLTVADVRGHQPRDLAKMWAHKSCARTIRTEVWKREKHKKAEELRQLNIVKQYYGELQKQAIFQMRNDQEFYCDVAFSNWLSDKGIPEHEHYKYATMLQRERYPEAYAAGLVKRLKAGGRMTKNDQRKDATAKKQIGRLSFFKEQSGLTEKTSGMLTSKTLIPERRSPVNQVNLLEVKQVVRVEKQSNAWATPYSQKGTVPGRSKSRWNFSTNLKSAPITDIKCKDIVALSIFPDEMETVLPSDVGLPVHLVTGDKPNIKVTLPDGYTQSAGIRMPRLPSALVNDELSGTLSDRIRIPQEFKAVHVYDIQKRKQPDEKPKDEVAMHLSSVGDPRILRWSVSSSSGSTSTGTPVSSLGSKTWNDCPAPRAADGYTRLLDTLNRMNPPAAFLA